MKLEDAVDFWASESGFRQIQDYLSRKLHGVSKYAQANYLWNIYNTRRVEDAIETLRDAMEPAEDTEVYYRGSPSRITNTHKREGFFSLAYTPEKAATYGKVYKVYVKPEVPRLKVAVEGGEVLLHDGMQYKYGDGTITVSMPTNNSVPFLGNLYTRRREAGDKAQREKIERILGYILCYLQLTPEDGIYYESCDPEVLVEFSKLTLTDKFAKVRELLPAYEYKDELFSEVAMMLNEPEQTIRNLVGGRRRRRRGQRTRRRRAAA